MFLADFRCSAGHQREVLLASRDGTLDRGEACADCGGELVHRVDAVESFLDRQREFSAARDRRSHLGGFRAVGSTSYSGGPFGVESRTLRATRMPTREKPEVVGIFRPRDSMVRDRERIVASRGGRR